MVVLVYVWIYKIKHFFMGVLVQIIWAIFTILEWKKKGFFFKKNTITILVQLRQFCLMKLILIYVLIYFLFNFHKILLWQLWATTHIAAWLLLKRPRKGETRGFGHVSEAAFTMCGNPNKVFSTDNSPQLTFRFTWPAWL